MRLVKFVAVPSLLAAAVLAQLAFSTGKSSSPAPPDSDQGVSVLISATDGKGLPLHSLAMDQVSVSDDNQPAKTLTVLDASDLPSSSCSPPKTSSARNRLPP